jgi:hypothetical protein
VSGIYIYIYIHTYIYICINGKKRRALSLKGSDFEANEAERSSLISIYTAHAHKREIRGDAGREWWPYRWWFYHWNLNYIICFIFHHQCMSKYIFRIIYFTIISLTFILITLIKVFNETFNQTSNYCVILFSYFEVVLKVVGPWHNLLYLHIQICSGRFIFSFFNKCIHYCQSTSTYFIIL